VINKVGFFHFGKQNESPILALQGALIRRRESVPGSLIVLPEGFNIGKAYKTSGICNTDRSVLSRLQTLSGEFQVAFVAGLIIDEGNGVDPPYNSAYLIDDSRQIPMCRKMDKDGWQNGGTRGENNYSHCVDDCDCNNPLEYEGLCIAALICIDANPQQIRAPKEFARLEKVISDLGQSDSVWKLLCIPACVANNFSGGKVGQVALDLNRHQKKIIVVMANSDFHDVDSFITDEAVEIVRSVPGRCNEVEVAELKELRK